ncbi:MOSC domain-containing protein [Actinoplanes sp. NPDC049668]|uniref:MOSC domain-containing protein n=1 Tax=unclassified Actinoplanes TaxID=2626549 RepID=UPI0033A4F4CC
MSNAVVLQVNLAVPEKSNAKHVGTTGINKQPVDHPVAVRAPGPKRTGLHSGLVGDQIFDTEHHGGDDQAVYAYAREDYDWWEERLDRKLPSGIFGENLTTAGLDVNGAMLGETWRIGDELVLQTTFGRIPCATFQWKMAEPQWVKRFGAERRPGAYLRVVRPGNVQAGDRIEILDRPGHGVSVADGFHAWLHEPERLRGYLDLELPETLKDEFRRRLKI